MVNVQATLPDFKAFYLTTVFSRLSLIFFDGGTPIRKNLKSSNQTPS